MGKGLEYRRICNEVCQRKDRGIEGMAQSKEDEMNRKEPLQQPNGTHAYDDIIDLEYPLKQHDRIKHPPMSIADRAKIFSPFAALKGYEEAIHLKEMD